MAEKKKSVPLFSVKYSLTQQEVRQAVLLHSGKKPHYVKSIFQTVIACVAILLCILRIIDNPQSPLYYLLAGLCLTLLVVSWVMPMRLEERMFNRDVQGKEIQMTLCTDEILFITDDASAAYILPLDKTYRYAEDRELFLLYLNETRIMAIPKRSMIPEQISMLQKKLRSGALKRGEEDKSAPAQPADQKPGEQIAWTPAEPTPETGGQQQPVGETPEVPEKTPDKQEEQRGEQPAGQPPEEETTGEASNTLEESPAARTDAQEKAGEPPPAQEEILEELTELEERETLAELAQLEEQAPEDSGETPPAEEPPRARDPENAPSAEQPAATQPEKPPAQAGQSERKPGQGKNRRKRR